MAQFDARAFMASVRREIGERQSAPWNVRALVAVLRLSGSDFLEGAYRLMLGRQPDVTGAQGYMARTASLLGRLRILLALALSPEQDRMPDWLRRVLVRLRGRRH